MVEVTFRLEDLDAGVILAQDEAIDKEIRTVLGELKTEEQRYVEVLECISKVI